MIRSHIDAIIRNFASNYGISDPNMTTETIASMLGIDEETMKSSIRPNAENEAKVELLVNAVIDKEKIEATEEDLEEYLKKISGSVNASVDEIKKYFGMDYVENEYKKEKAMEIIAESAVPVEPKKAKKPAAKKAPRKTEKQAEEKPEETPEEKPVKKTSRKTAKAADASEEKAEKPAKKTSKKAETAEEKPAKKPAAKKTARKAEE